MVVVILSFDHLFLLPLKTKIAIILKYFQIFRIFVCRKTSLTTAQATLKPVFAAPTIATILTTWILESRMRCLISIDLSRFCVVPLQREALKTLQLHRHSQHDFLIVLLQQQQRDHSHSKQPQVAIPKIPNHNQISKLQELNKADIWLQL